MMLLLMMMRRGLKVSKSVSKCLKECQGISKYSMSVGYLECVLRVSGRCLGGLCRVSGGCMKGVCKSVGYLVLFSVMPPGS